MSQFNVQQPVVRVLKSLGIPPFVGIMPDAGDVIAETTALYFKCDIGHLFMYYINGVVVRLKDGKQFATMQDFMEDKENMKLLLD